MISNLKENRKRYLSMIKYQVICELASIKNKVKRKLGIKAKTITKEYEDSMNNSLFKIDKLVNQEYCIFHNPKWLGVTSATKELFENNIPLEEIFRESDISKIAKAIIESGVRQVIFSSFNIGWDKLAREIKKQDKEIKLKTFWHGSHSQIVEDFNWEMNKNIILLHEEKIIDVMGTCKESLVNFYKKQGYTTAYIMNTVRVKDNEKYKKNNYINEVNNKIGLYAAGNDWRKNMCTQIVATSMIKNCTLDIIPKSILSNRIADLTNLDLIGLDKGISREELLDRMSKNELNLYVTFSECAPILPLESLEVGVPCITGNNHHYFKDTELEEYLVVKREDDANCIKDKIELCLNNKQKIMELYKKWKEEYDKLSQESIEKFLSM